MGAQSVGFFEAWFLWAQGVDLKPMALYGFPMIWVGRIAKIITYIGGTTIVLDILGSARVSTFARSVLRPYDAITGKAPRHAQDDYNPSGFVSILLSGVASITAWWMTSVGLAYLRNDYSLYEFLVALSLLVCAVIISLIAIESVLYGTLTLAGRALKSDRGQTRAKWTGFVLIAIGFSFDLLTS